jgi:hypothetical protein
MSNVVVNRANGFVTHCDSGEFYRELEGFSARRMFEDRNGFVWEKHSSIMVNTLMSVYPARIMFGTRNGIARVVSVMAEVGTQHLRVFSVADTETATEVANKLVANCGWLTPEENAFIIAHKETYAHEAQKVYSCEATYFGEDNFTGQVRVIAEQGALLAKEFMMRNNHKTDYLTKGEAIDLIQQVADDYGLRNVEIDFFGDAYSVRMGSCGATNYPVFGPVTGVKMSINTLACFRHVILHELAHAIDQFNNRLSSHGKLWRNVYSELLAKYHDGVIGVFDDFDNATF